MPPAWVAFLKSQGIGSPGNSWQLSKHLDDMDRAGVATSLLSLASPGIWHGRDLGAIRKVAREINEFTARLSVDYPGRFGNFATLPLPDVEGSLPEVAYALDVLKADGICMRTPYGNVWHGDPVFAPLYEELNRRNAVVFTHPQDADCCENLVPGIPSQSSIDTAHTPRGRSSACWKAAWRRGIRTSAGCSRTPAAPCRSCWRASSAGSCLTGPDGMVTLDPSDTSRQGGPERLALLRRFYYEVAQQTNVVALGRAPPGRADLADRVRHRLPGVGFRRACVAPAGSRHRARGSIQRR